MPVTEGSKILLSSYSDLATAISDISATNCELVIDTDETMTANTSIPSNVSLTFIKGNLINTTTSYTLTINGPLEAGMYQIFAVSSTVELADGVSKNIYPQWWGAVGDGSTDCTYAITSALNAGNGRVRFVSGTYCITNSSTIYSKKNLDVCFDSDAWIDATSSTATNIFIFQPTDPADTFYDFSSNASRYDKTIIINDSGQAEAFGNAVSNGDMLWISTRDDWVCGVTPGGDGELWKGLSDQDWFKGEFAEVESVSVDSSALTTTVTLKSSLWDDYTIGSARVGKVNPISGSLENFQMFADPDNEQVGVRIYFSRNYKVKGGEIRGSSYQGLSVELGWHVMVDGFTASEILATVSHYGLTVNSCQDTVVQNCNLYGGTHALDLTGHEPNRNILIVNNIIDNAHASSSYASFGTHENTENLNVINNIIKNCMSVSAGINVTISDNKIFSQLAGKSAIAIYTYTDSKQLLISNNSIVHADETSYSSGGIWITGFNSPSSWESVIVKGNVVRAHSLGLLVNRYTISSSNSEFTIDNLSIVDNIFRNTGSLGYCCRIKGFESDDVVYELNCNSILFSGNQFTGEYKYGLQGEYLKARTSDFRDNTFAHSGTSNITSYIHLQNDVDINTISAIANNGYTSKCGVLCNNPIVAVAELLFYATNNIWNSCQRKGFYVSVNNDRGRIMLKDNVVLNDTDAYSLYANGQHICGTFGNNNQISSASAAPTGGTWNKGDIVYNSSPSAGSAQGWLCVTGGTFESAPSPITADTTTNSAELNGISDTSEFTVGDCVNVSSGFTTTGPFHIIDLTSTTMTLDEEATSSASGVTVTLYTNNTLPTTTPVFKAMANIAS